MKSYLAVALLLGACVGTACDSISSALDDSRGDVGSDASVEDTHVGETQPFDGDDAEAHSPAACTVPQAPRDLDEAGGTNAAAVPGPAGDARWLCNVHFHNPIEHVGHSACPGAPEPDGPLGPVCSHVEDGHASGTGTGDIVEVHWVYSSCEAERSAPPAPGQGLSPCLCPGGQILRVRAQVFVVAEGSGEPALEAPPEGTTLVSYAGSTTGPSYSNTTCSDVAVNWEVATDCRTLDREALGGWCEDNAFGEEHGHDARELVTDEAWLSPYAPQ